MILIDDVMTSGAHPRAAAAYLRDKGFVVIAAVCAGRSDNAFTGKNAFIVRVDQLEDFQSSGPVES